MRNRSTKLGVVLGLTLLGACAHPRPTIQPVASVDLSRFMGDWYVIASIPTRFEREAYSAVESYELRPDGRIATTFRYRNGALDAPEKTMRPVGSVRPDTGNAVWDMRFWGIINAEYVIVYLKDDYSQTIIGRSDRDYAWIMARTPSISEDDYQRATERLRSLGYSLNKLRKVPQPGASPLSRD